MIVLQRDSLVFQFPDVDRHVEVQIAGFKGIAPPLSCRLTDNGSSAQIRSFSRNGSSYLIKRVLYRTHYMDRFVDAGIWKLPPQGARG